MNALNSFMSLSVPAGRIAGISIRIHILFLIYLAVRLWELRDGGAGFGLAVFAGLYICILLHEFGHALCARWCGGEADEILIWPLGGLAYCRPPLHPTPHLITTLGGPFVTLVLWALLTAVAGMLQPERVAGLSEGRYWIWIYIAELAALNGYMLLFNLLPAFPLDGGRALRDTLWHWLPIQKANRIAAVVGIIACLGLISWGVSTGNQWMIFIGIYAIMGGAQEMASYEYVGYRDLEPWSLRERLRSRAVSHSVRGGEKRRSSREMRAYKPKMVPRLAVRDDRRAVEKVDAILEKISRSGLDSLTAEERRELERASAELKRQDG